MLNHFLKGIFNTLSNNRINIFANFGGNGGYQIVTYNTVMGLRSACLKRGLNFDDLFNLVPHSTNSTNNRFDAESISLFLSGKNRLGPVSFAILPLEKFHLVRGEKLIGYPAIETLKLTEMQKAFLSIPDELFSTSKIHQKLYQEAGMKCDHALLGSYNPTVFYPENEDSRKEKSSKMDPKSKDTIVFLMVGKYEFRKASIEAIAAFCNFFENHPLRSRVVLKAKFLSDVYSRNIVQIKQELQGLFFKYPKATQRILLVEDKTTDMTRLYHDADFLLFPTRGEGIGLPLIEALASGVTPIVTPYTSLPDYANASNSILLKDLGTEPFIDPFYGLNELNGGVLGKVTVESVQEALKAAVSLTPEEKLSKVNLGIEDVKSCSYLNRGDELFRIFEEASYF